MKSTLLSLSLALGSVLATAMGTVAKAETVVVDDQVMVRASSVERPARGITMGAVEARFGAPANRHAAVGTPPITRWDYAGFVVYFEHERVIDAVATGP
jgi:hypothetical protein